jgi:para-aminobenzoate synthetase component I
LNTTIKKYSLALNKLGKDQVPFLFFIDYEMRKPVVFRLDEIDKNILLYNINGVSNASDFKCNNRLEYLNKFPVDIETYKKAFENISQAINKGYSYLVNLTFRTQIKTNLTLKDLFSISTAKYKIFFNNQFLCFSPETFITINNGIITTCPMKGTINASIPEAANKIIDNKKEKAEHDTIIDLLRNDLSKIAGDVRVKRYRYIEKIHSGEIDLLQVSSEITGKLDENYNSGIGEIICSLLPAGSICGAPKKSTIDIIKKAEKNPRGYYTGICGIFDGTNLDSGVMIRFIENYEGVMYYRSGGGITSMSKMEDEYNELIDKIYVPVN